MSDNKPSLEKRLLYILIGDENVPDLEHDHDHDHDHNHEQEKQE